MPKSKKRFNFSLSSLPRPRWNVLDMIHIVGHGAIPTYIFCDIDMTWAEDLRANSAYGGPKISYTAILLKAIGIAQRAHPDSRTSILPFGRTLTLNDIVAGFTVERFIGDQPAVFFGAIERPDIKSVEELSTELRQYAECDMQDLLQLERQHMLNGMPAFIRRAILWVGIRVPRVRLAYLGATFGLSSMGKSITTAIIPPCLSTSTFGIGLVGERPVVKNGAVEIRPMMTVTLNFDHRLIDGAPAARFMADVKRLMEGELANYMPVDLAEDESLLPSALART